MRTFEIVRVSYLLANRRFVISETGNDPDVEKDFADGMIFAEYERLVETCLDYLPRQARRRAIAKRGLDAMRRRPQAALLRDALEHA
jgi:hypothetical protein